VLGDERKLDIKNQVRRTGEKREVDSSEVGWFRLGGGGRSNHTLLGREGKAKEVHFSGIATENVSENVEGTTIASRGTEGRPNNWRRFNIGKEGES